MQKNLSQATGTRKSSLLYGAVGGITVLVVVCMSMFGIKSFLFWGENASELPHNAAEVSDSSPTNEEVSNDSLDFQQEITTLQADIETLKTDSHLQDQITEMKTQISQLQTLQLTLQSGQTEIESSLSTLFPLGSFIAINGTVTKDQMNALGRALCDGSSIGSQVKDAVLQGTTLNLAGRTLVGEGKYAKDETITFQLGHVDEYTIGDATYKGEPMHLLTFAEMPYHTHGISTKIAQGGNGTEFPFPNEKYSSTAAEIATQPAGGDQPHNNMSPFHVVQWYIKVK